VAGERVCLLTWIDSFGFIEFKNLIHVDDEVQKGKIKSAMATEKCRTSFRHSTLSSRALVEKYSVVLLIVI
jgi:hypothetical protein